MYLKALEIQGFKSFPDKTRLTFDKDITAIVGPNGSGKSNISDAILWVMGEQRTKTLRSTKMEDVIFGGTEKRSKLGFAQVTLIIDNSARIFDSDLPEIMLTRRFYRSGDSEYFINRESCRLKDINSLLMDTGLGRDGYSIIGQGKIAEIVSSKSTDRREVFEEAAGISRYRYRKEEAEKKLEKTEENLVRVNDKIEELEGQVVPLKKQAEVAKKYLVLRDRLKDMEISLWMDSLDRLHRQAESILAEYAQTESSLTASKDKLNSIYRSSESITERMHDKDIETEEARGRQSAKEAQAAQCESEIAVIQANIKSNSEALGTALADIEDRERRAKEIELAVSSGAEQIESEKAKKKALEASLTEADNCIAALRIKAQGREKIAADLAEQSTKMAIEVRTVESRINILTEMENDYEGYSKAVKFVMRESERGSIKGVFGPVANLIRTDEEYAVAIETALGGESQNIVVATQAVGRTAIEMLKQHDSGRATFLPLDTIKARPLQNVPVNDRGFVGVASELINYDPRFSDIFSFLLGRTVVAETLSDAIRISNNSGNRLRIVTLDGQMINAGGQMTGGSLAKNVGIISRANELERLKKSREGYLAKEKECADNLAKAKSNLALINDNIEEYVVKRNSVNSELAAAAAAIESDERAVAQLRTLLSSLSTDSSERQKAVDRNRQINTDLEAQLCASNSALEQIRRDIATVKDEIAEISKAKLELESRRTQNDRESQSLNGEIISLERSLAKIEQRKLSAELEEKQLIDKLWDGYELSYDQAQSIRKPVENVQKLSKDISSLRREITMLGNPNLGAIEEYERVNARYEFLCGQRDDVEKAKKEVVDIIRSITDEMKSIFTEKFNEINESFKTTFLELFGGGKANLVLEDPDNVLECGIEIKVQPPGKALSSISLMSGGEMAFVAIALYFAILKVRPTPFCVMDEIEAALDEANVLRYAQYMRKVSDHTQFIVITHRRGTMEEADALYGVTMQEKGVSSVLALDLNTAKKVAEA